MDRTILPGRYRHFKGSFYDVIGVAANTETGEQYVVYVATDNHARLWARPLTMFTESVQHEGQCVMRFRLIEAGCSRCAADESAAGGS